MSKLVRWKDNVGRKIDDAIRIVCSKNNLAKMGERYHDVRVIKDFDAKQNYKCLDYEVEFNSFLINYNVRKNDGYETVSCRLIIYKANLDNIYYISNHLNFQPVLRLLLGYTKNKEIELDNIDVSSDMLMWLVSKTYFNNTEKQMVPYKRMVIEKMVGFKGVTDDEINKVEAMGDSVLKLLSTLAFILESKGYRNANIQLSYGAHRKLQIKLSSTNMIVFDTKCYYGELGNVDGYVRDDKIAILIYQELLPALVKWYERELDDGCWTRETQERFLSMIAEDVKDRIDKRIESLRVI